MKSSANLIAAACVAFTVGIGASLSAHAQASSETFGDWAKLCEKAGKSERCYLLQTVKVDERPIMVVIIAYSPKRDKVAAMIDVPLGMHIPSGLEVQANGVAAKPLPFEQCLPTGCRAILQLNEATLEVLKAGGNASITGKGRDGAPVEMPISGNGFNEAFNAL